MPPRLRLLALAAAGFAAVAVIAVAVGRAERPAPTLETPLLTRYGCDTCHAPGAQFRARLRDAADQSTAEVVERILHAERFDPKRRMPSYAGTLGEEQARALAVEVQAVARAMRDGSD
jgi:mono/diheme cytochrome c family protein